MPEGRYVAKPQTVTAIQWTGDNAAEVKTWAGEIPSFEGERRAAFLLPGDMPGVYDVARWWFWAGVAQRKWVPVQVGFWMARGDTLGTQRVLSPEEFDARYEPVPSTEPEPTPVRVIADQPPPVPNDGPALWDLVLADMRERHQIGIQRYGTALQANNGRDMLVDAYQEILDLAVYLRGEIEERRRYPRRDDAVAGWLRGQRDVHEPFTEWWKVTDALLSDYLDRQHGGTPLDG
jgi:hypothetical protein